MIDIFSRMDALVFPSVWEETSGIGAREALSAGVPVIATRIGGIPESVHHGVNGLLFDPGDAADLARQIRRLLDEPDLLDRLSANCRTPLTLADDVAATRALYEQVIREHAATSRTSVSTAARSKVAAVVLNYQTTAQTALTTTMLMRSDTPPSMVVVDNGDGRELTTRLREMAGDVRVCATGSNLGFSAGCNAGIVEALKEGADAVLLVNSDVIVPPDCLGMLIGAMAAQRHPGIVGPLVRSRAWPGQVLSAGIDVDAGSGRIRQRIEPPDGRVAAAVSGCAMLVHRAVFARIGLLPEDYFFSFEDIAFCQRAHAAGFDVSVVPAASVYHEGSGTMGVDPRRLYFAARNHLKLGLETPARSPSHRLLRQHAIAFYNLAHAVGASGGNVVTRLAAVTRGIAHHLQRRYGKD